MTDVVVSIASKVAEYLVAPVGRQCGYVMFTNSYVGELKEELKKLENARLRVQHSVDEARNNMKPIEDDVEEWLTSVVTVANKAPNAPEHGGRVKKICFCGWLPNPKDRYCVGRDARKRVKAIQELIQQGQFVRVYHEGDPPGHAGGALNVNLLAGDGGNTITDSRVSIFQGIMKALDDEKLKVIGVYGPGGVGKTTLLEEVEKKFKKEGRSFQMIAKAKVSQTPDLKKIQDDIAYALGLNLKDEPSEVGRRERLFQRLQKDPNEKVLIILDDLWDKLDLKAIGIPSQDESRGCKLLLSSRIKDVLEQKMGADPTFRLEGLSKEEAFRLFEKTVGHRLKEEEELKPIAAQVVNKLAGLPLLINSVAMLLKNSKVGAWRNAAKKINAEEIETIVQPSYDHLKGNDIKALFLLCGLIGGTIKVETLLVLGKGLGLFEGFEETIQDSRDRLDTMLSELLSSCLLLDGGDDKENVTIHDLYSEVVVSTPFRDQNSLIISDNCGTWPKEKLDECRACLVDVGNDRLVELMPHRFPQAKILMLSGKNDMGDCSKQYFEDRSITSLPSPIEILGNLQSLIINCDVEDVAILGKLKALQILSFAGSNISKLPKEIGELMNLKSLNLSKCRWLEIIESGVLKGLINLEELYMRDSFDQWMGNDEVPSESCNAKLAELKSLTKLTALEIWIPDPTVLLEAGDLPFGNLTRFWINIGNVYDNRVSDGLTTMKLKLGGCHSILSEEWVQKTLHKTECLYLDGLGESKENAPALFSAHELCTQGFPQLKRLKIRNCPSIEYIASSSGGIPLTAFTRLESLHLENLVNLEKICHGPVAPECLSKLKDVNVTKCNRLKYLWCLSQMRRSVHLEKIEVSACKSMRAIVIDDARGDIVGDDIVEWPNVRRLKLDYLPKMTSFCIGAGITLEGAPVQMKEEGSRSKGVVMSFPSLTDISILGCRNFGAFNSSPASVDRKLDKAAEENDESPQPLFNKMVKLPEVRSLHIEGAQCKELWNNQIPDDSFCKLEYLLLWNCHNLQRAVPSHMWKRLHRCLEILRVKSCPSIEIIYEGDETVTKGGKLRRLVLCDLENLSHIWQSDGDPNVPLPNLRLIEVKSCPRLRMLFPTFTPEFLGQIKELVVGSCEDLELIAGHEECEEATGRAITFSKLTALRLFKLPKFKSFLPEKYSVKFPSSIDRVSYGTEPDQDIGDWESFDEYV